jgi:hypothetical protein
MAVTTLYFQKLENDNERLRAERDQWEHHAAAYMSERDSLRAGLEEVHVGIVNEYSERVWQTNFPTAAAALAAAGRARK